VLNTSGPGAVIASAAVGALLQNRLAAALAHPCRRVRLPAPGRVPDQFVAGFAAAARGGLEIGAGPDRRQRPLVPPGVARPGGGAGDAARALDVRQAFVDAMRPTLVLPIAVLVAGGAG